MKDCWNAKPEDRPDFNQCKVRIKNILEQLSPNTEFELHQSDFSNFLASSSQCNSYYNFKLQ